MFLRLCRRCKGAGLFLWILNQRGVLNVAAAPFGIFVVGRLLLSPSL